MTDRLQVDVAVIGAGPAGLSASIAAARCGASVAVLDCFPVVGGQYHMQPRADLHKLVGSVQAKDGATLEREAREAGVQIFTNTELFWARPGFDLYANRAGEALACRCRELIVACGAQEVVIPFPGWTLPGVTTAGAAQRLLKAGATFEGRSVLAGTGPFLLAVAATFAKAHVRLEALVERIQPGPGHLSLLARYPERAPEALALAVAARRIARHRLYGYVVVEALGRDRLEAIRIAPVDRTGKPQLGSAMLLDGLDSLCISHGFRPNVEVTTLLGAEHGFDPKQGGWYCKADPASGMTSVLGLRAAGETTGIAGATAARVSGTLAGMAAAESMGIASAKTADRKKSLARLERARRFAKGLSTIWPLPRELIENISKETIICRCEDVTRREIEGAIEDGAPDVFALKMWTRAGMGPCQGRVCGPIIANLAARLHDVDEAAIGLNRPHLPLRPVPVQVVKASLD
jgi:NADPH-dependent 2,4-dienoyl-CoA reductase/sulfur reductase-like enzyme